MEKDVHQLVMLMMALLCILSFAAFLYLIDYASRLLRPISILTRVCEAGLAVIEGIHPEPSRVSEILPRGSFNPGQPDGVIRYQGTLDIILAVNLEPLMAEAKRSCGVIEFAPQVGDFVAVDDPFFNLYGGARSVDEETLRSAIAFGSERTLEQDPTFALRIVVDIALRALSAAINDPTTAVLAIDQLHRMLRIVGKRHHLLTDEILDEPGQLRVILRTPNWKDFVHLAFSEIRSRGSTNLQIVRRLRAMIENLIQTLPTQCHPMLQKELNLLDREIVRHFSYPEELALARVADSQGLGGRSGKINRGMQDAP